VLLLCGSVLAGDMNSPPIAPCDANCPPSSSQPANGQTADSSLNDTGTPATTSDGSNYGDNADYITAAALTVLDSVLALL
jgi:hypothetical protein